MLCILKMSGGQISAWIIAHDVPEARRMADMAGEQHLAQMLYRIEFTPPPGRHDLPGGYVMLVQ